MARNRIREWQSLEGRQVCLALDRGERIDDCQLVSTGRSGVDTLWIFTNGSDRFIPRARVVDLWETAPTGSTVTWGRGQLIGIREWDLPLVQQVA
jgi:hypothetical protein